MTKTDVFGGRMPELAFERTPVVGKHLKKLFSDIDLAVRRLGLCRGIKKVLLQKGAKISVQHDDQKSAGYIRRTGQPVIIAATHDSLAEPLIVLSSLCRSDIKMFFADGLPQYPYLNSFLIPLYNTAPKNIFRPDRSILKLLGGRALDIPREKAFELNSAGLQFAAEELTEGKLIVIFPDGNVGLKDAPWSRGIGRLITAVGSGSGGHIIFADVAGAGRLEYAKLLNPFTTTKPFQHAVVRFSKPINIDEIIKEGNSDKDSITGILNSRYNSWK